MLFGGLQKSSMIDYPGKIACVLFLSGCNFNCPYCHNPQLAKSRTQCPPILDEQAVDAFLSKRKSFLDGVVISGGEPTLQSDITSLCAKVKKMGYPVKLDTNGSQPRVLGRLIDESLVDYIAMDIKTDPFQYDPLLKSPSRKANAPDAILESIELIMASGVDYEFRTTCVKPLVDARVIAKIVRHIQNARLYALQRFESHTVLQPDFFQQADAGYEHKDLTYFKSIAEPWVEACVVR